MSKTEIKELEREFIIKQAAAEPQDQEDKGQWRLSREDFDLLMDNYNNTEIGTCATLTLMGRPVASVEGAETVYDIPYGILKDKERELRGRLVELMKAFTTITDYQLPQDHCGWALTPEDYSTAQEILGKEDVTQLMGMPVVRTDGKKTSLVMLKQEEEL